MAHHCNCARCPRRWLPWRVRVAAWVITAGLAYWKLYLLVTWLGSLSQRVHP